MEGTMNFSKTNYDQSKFGMLVGQLDIVPGTKEFSTIVVQIDLKKVIMINMVKWHR